MADNTCYGDFRSAQIESFELRNGKLYLYGDGFTDGCLILHLFHIISIQKIPAGTELALDDGATSLILSNQFNDAAVEAVWRWYGNRDDKVKCSRQTLRPPPLDPESENLPSPPKSNASAVHSELPLEPSFKVLTIESEMKLPTGKLHVTESVLELPCQLATLDSELQLARIRRHVRALA